jgi:hypothetical protein
MIFLIELAEGFAITFFLLAGATLQESKVELFDKPFFDLSGVFATSLDFAFNGVLRLSGVFFMAS